MDYLSALEGLAYGDDPADGVVRGRRFIHSRLGVAFEAPEGFTLENTSQAVLGASADGSRRLLFDAADTPNGQSLEEVLRSHGTTPSSPAASGRRRSMACRSQARCRLERSGRSGFRPSGSAIRHSALSWRFAPGRQISKEYSNALWRPSGRSRAEEARDIKPLRIEIVTATEGDTVQSLAARMAVDRPLDRFLLINGMDRNDPIKVGQRYKIAIE